MSSTLLSYHSPSTFVMSQSQQINHIYNTNQSKIKQESKQSHPPRSPFNHPPAPIHTDNTHHITKNDIFEPHTTDKIQLKSTNRSSHHEVSADNWRIKYYMDLNLVKKPQHISMPYRSSSLPQESTSSASGSATYTNTPHHTPPTKLPSQTADFPPYLNQNYHLNASRKSIERGKPQNIDSLDTTINTINAINNAINHDHHKKVSHHHGTKKKLKRNKTIHVVSRTKSQNNTPPRQFESMLKRHHKKSRLSRIRSRSDGMLSFCVNKTSSPHGSDRSDRSLRAERVHSNHSTEIEDDDDNDSVSTAMSAMSDSSNNNVNNQHFQCPVLPPLIPGANSKNLTPPRTKHYRASPHSSLIYQSSRTPPGNNYISTTHNQASRTPLSHRQSVQKRKIKSEPVGLNGNENQNHRRLTTPHKSQSIAIRRSRPLSINKHKVKPRFDVDFKPSNSDQSYQPSSDPFFNGLTNPDSLVDDEANFDMD